MISASEIAPAGGILKIVVGITGQVEEGYR
jgi:hypothetical protein